MPKYTGSKEQRWFPREQTDAPSPVSYNNEAKFVSRSFKLARAKNERFVDELIKRKKQIPGPSAYDITSADKWISTGVGKSYK